MATIKDIARLAKVSQGTVSNVLNERGNVSVERILAVQKAARELGYVANAQAKQLRKDAPLSPEIAVILPNIEDERYAAFFSGAKTHAEQQGYSVQLFLTDSCPYTEEKIVRQIAALRLSGAITISCCIDHPTLYKPVLVNGGRVVHALREVKGADEYIGFDLRRVGHELGRYLLSQGYRCAGVLAGPHYYPDDRELVRGLQQAVNLPDAQPIEIQYIYADRTASSTAPFEFFRDGRRPDALVLTNSSYLAHVQLAARVGSTGDCPPVIVLSRDGLHLQAPQVARYCLDYLGAGIAAASRMLELLRRNTRPNGRHRTLLPARGFGRDLPVVSTPRLAKPVTLRVLITKGQTTDALLRITPDFTRRTGIEVEYIQQIPSEMLETVLASGADEQFDLVRNNMSILSLLPARLFYPFTEEEFSSLTAGMFPRVVRDFSRIEGKRLAIPFDIGAGMLFFRRDLFEDLVLRRTYYEKYGAALTAPQNYMEFVRIAGFFDRAANPESPLRAGTSVPLGSAAELCSNFILLYLNHAENPDFSRPGARIEPDAVLQSLRTLHAYGKHAAPMRQKAWIGATLDHFIHGQTAMEQVFLNYTSNIVQLHTNTVGGLLGFAPLPGGNTYITGGALSIHANCKNPEAAKQYIHWACGAQQAELFTTLGGLSPHAEIYRNPNILSLFPWYQQLPEIISRSCGREVWNFIDSHALEVRSFPLLRKTATGQLGPDEAAEQLLSVIDSCLLHQ
ncbi:extracellular solute-binding protein [Anaerotruncus rubiinfantis]|uniref:extracellular solute-binding protein n=1 Tax=Anaerotruncus rubiinfantis TaxID=1720200 RepID=UPI00189A9F9B|nr:extracellular solute-binding protein [Anaerotruncus rubiinfantis]